MKARYKLYYWPIPFRGHFIRFMLAQAGQQWAEASFEEVAALKDDDPTLSRYPVLAPPVLEDRVTGVRLAQMPAIVMALGREYSLIRDPDVALRLTCDASDILFEITRTHGAQMWDAPSWQGFVEERLPRWLAVHEAVAKTLDAGAPGAEEIILTALWHTMIDKLPPLRSIAQTHAPGLVALVDHVTATPAIAGVITDWADKKPIYCAGQIEASLLNVLNMES